MTSLVVLMVVALLLAGGALLFVAFPHRGRSVPGLPWLGSAVERVSDRVPTLREEDGDPATDVAEAQPGLFDEERPASR